ncbi:hypothetical protein VTH82DRAFT_8171 [Thermothelomyces myriococcoides]
MPKYPAGQSLPSFYSSLCDSYEEAQVLRRYWAKRNYLQDRLAVQSQADNRENMKSEDSEDNGWEDDEEDGKQIQERLEQARVNAIRNRFEN